MIIVFRADEKAAEHRADDGADNRLDGQDGADLPAVFVVGHVVAPRIVAGIVVHRTEKTHHVVGKNNHNRRPHRNARADSNGSLTDKFGKAE